MKNKVYLATLIVVWCLLRCGAPALAEPVTIFSNFGADMSFNSDPFAGWTINGFVRPEVGQQAIAERFAVSTASSFDRVLLPLTIFSGPGSIDVFLQSNTNGLPGAVLDVIALRGLSAGVAIHSADSSNHPILSPANEYWVSVVAGAPGVLAGWNWNSVGDVSDGSTFAGTQGGGPKGPWGLGVIGTIRSAFEVQGTSAPEPVPEPASIVLLTVGAAAIATRRRHDLFSATIEH
jgi:PEP-CTERM motif